jgi:hypothetical protein
MVSFFKSKVVNNQNPGYAQITVYLTYIGNVMPVAQPML